MSKRTFILRLDKENKEFMDYNDIYNLIVLRVTEAYIELNSENEIGLIFIASVRDYVDKNLKAGKDESSYYLDIDFENDITKS